MAYYRGDYYRGDYYAGRSRGDFLSAAGKLAGSLGNLLPNTWTPAGAQKVGSTIAGAALGAIGLKAAAPFVTTALSKLSSVSPMAAGLSPMAAPGTPIAMMPGGARMLSRGSFGHRRRINPANSRALSRALSRVKSFGKLASRARREMGKAATSVGVKRGGTWKRGKK